MISTDYTIGVIYITNFNEDYSGWIEDLRYVIIRAFPPRGIFIASNLNHMSLRVLYSLEKAFENYLGSDRSSRLSSESFITE